MVPILFDPKAFQDARGELKLEDYLMNEGELEEWAMRVMSVRAAIDDKANERIDQSRSHDDANVY